MLGEYQSALGIQVVRYSNIAAASFLIWEWCITLGVEATFIWSKASKCHPNKWAFILLRYYSIFVLICLLPTAGGQGVCLKLGICARCPTWYAFQLSSLQVIVALQQCIMAMRVYALHQASRNIGLLLGSAFTIQHLIMSACTIYAFPKVVYDRFCIAVSASPAVFGIGGPPLIFDFLLLILTIWGVRHSAPHNWRRTPLLRILLQDGTWAFLAVFGVFSLDGLFFYIFPGPVGTAVWSWQFTVASFSACRLVLHTYQHGHRNPPNMGGVQQLPTSSHSTPSHQEAFALTTFSPGTEFEVASFSAPLPHRHRNPK